MQINNNDQKTILTAAMPSAVQGRCISSKSP